MLLGYNTNGFAHHDLLDAIDVLANIGFRSVAITLDHQALNPYSADVLEQVARVHDRLARHAMRSVVETGARFLLDPWTKHEPTLVSATPVARQRRIDFLRRAIDLAAELGSDCVSLWSGILRDDTSSAEAWTRLVSGLNAVLEHAAARNMPLGFEPEPGMFVESMPQFEELQRRVDAPLLKLTLDVGHLHCLNETPIAAIVRCHATQLINVHIEDMRSGVHEHLMFGAGEMDFPPILAALRDVGYSGGVHVELSRHSHEAPAAARRSFDFLNRIEIQKHW